MDIVDIDALEETDSLEILCGGVLACLVTSHVRVDTDGILCLGEEHVVVDVGVSLERLVGVERRHVAACDTEGALGRGADEIGVHASEKTLTKEALGNGRLGKLAVLRELVVPVPRGR